VWFPNSIFARFSGSYLKLGKLYGQNHKNQGAIFKKNEKRWALHAKR
jgi:hypothetical protein